MPKLVVNLDDYFAKDISEESKKERISEVISKLECLRFPNGSIITKFNANFNEIKQCAESGMV